MPHTLRGGDLRDSALTEPGVLFAFQDDLGGEIIPIDQSCGFSLGFTRQFNVSLLNCGPGTALPALAYS